MRLFIAIPLAPEVINVLDRLTRTLQSAHDNLRWSSRDTWHITLQFLGETPIEKYNCVVRQLSQIQSPPVPIWLQGTGCFDRAGVFFAGVNVPSELRHLEKKVTAATSQCGVVAEDRPYHPHVTLARAKGDNRARALGDLKSRINPDHPFPPFTAREFLLFESFLGRDGVRHEVRATFPLRDRQQ